MPYDTIKVGQTIVIDNDVAFNKYKTGTVTKVTKTQIAVQINDTIRRFNKRNGVEIGAGDSYIRPRIAVTVNWNYREKRTLMTIEEMEKIQSDKEENRRKKILGNAIKNVSIRKYEILSVEELESIADKLGIEK